jgi:hypothetical protein
MRKHFLHPHRNRNAGWLETPHKQTALPGRAPPEKASELFDAPSIVPEVAEGLCLPRFHLSLPRRGPKYAPPAQGCQGELGAPEVQASTVTATEGRSCVGGKFSQQAA